MKEKVLKIRKDQARIGGRKLIYLLQEDFKKAGIRIGRDKFFKFLKAQHLLVRRKKNRTITTRSYQRFRASLGQRYYLCQLQKRTVVFTFSNRCLF